MINYTDKTCTIQCDKCGHEETGPKETYNDQFWASGWSFSSSARKYIHKCYNCLTAKEKKTMDFIKGFQQ